MMAKSAFPCRYRSGRGSGSQSEVTRAQFERRGGLCTSIVRSGEITAKNGAIQQSNFNDYPWLGSRSPGQTNVYITESSARRPAWESGSAAFVAAFCNANFAETERSP